MNEAWKNRGPQKATITIIHTNQVPMHPAGVPPGQMMPQMAQVQDPMQQHNQGRPPLVELHVRAHGLSKSGSKHLNTFCVLKAQQGNGYVEVGRTKVVLNTYNFEQHQYLVFEVYEVNGKSNGGPLESHILLGHCQTRLATLVGMVGGRLSMQISGCNSTLSVTAVEKEHNLDRVVLRLRVSNVDKKDIFGKSDPYICISRQSSNGMLQVYRSEVHWCTYSCTFQTINEGISHICRGNMDMPLQFHVWDCDKHSDDDFIGGTLVTLRQLVPGAKFPLINDELKGKRGYQNSGVLEVLDFRILNRYTFLDLIGAGLQMTLLVGIDYTASNLPTNRRDSLHYLGGGPDEENQYAQCLRSVVGILSEYDADQQFPIFGFGAKVNGETSHCFSATLTDNPLVTGIDGLLEAYHKAAKAVIFHGPTIFSPLIQAAIAQAQHARRNEYMVMLILTDGVLDDITETKAAIVAASRWPISIIIVGIGQTDFSDMNQLLPRSGPLVCPYTGQTASRNIVQFVGYSYIRDMQRLTQEVLREIPKQTTEFMTGINVTLDEIRQKRPYADTARQLVMPEGPMGPTTE